MTAQEVFNKIIDHLIAQGRAAANEKGECMYRGPARTKCAVGCLIPDDEYIPAMEGKPANKIQHLVGPETRDLLWTHATLLGAIQRIHDSGYCWNASGGLSVDGKRRLRAVAVAHRLSVPVEIA